MNEQMIERIARAIFETHNAAYTFGGPAKWESDPEHWRRYARAAHSVMAAKIEELTDLPRLIELQRTAAPDCEREDGWNAGLDRAAEVVRTALAPHPEGTDQ